MDRVVFVIPSYEIGGAQRVLLTLLGNVDRTRIAPELVVFDATGGLLPQVPDDVPVHDLGRPRLRAAIPSLFNTLRRLRPDTVFSTLGYVNLAILAMRPFLGFRPRVIIRESNTPSDSLPSLPYSGIISAAYRMLYRRADHVICQSEIMAQDLVQNFNVRPDQVVQLPNPVDVTAIREGIRNPVRAKGGGLRLVSAGHLIHQKAYDHLLDMFADLPTNSQMTIFGDGAERASLEAQIVKLGIADRVRLPGFVPDPWPEIAGADGFLMPSRWEGLPNAALEALVCGTPVIATPTTGGLVDVAAQAPDGAVTLVPFGAEFLKAMAALEPNPDMGKRPNLLPDDFALDRVAAAFNALLT
ncbi:MAG: glycosyltransferase [Alphaproteobacteria bacterium]|jgi:glycosyltransferase involved in cell wall biosynthesis|nr:glycosyltransferase [Alphaproteobacteria bacterium]